MEFEKTRVFAEKMDQKDPLAAYRNEFHIPRHQGGDSIYFTGNSLGLQPKTVLKAVQIQLDKWAKEGVEGHFTGKDQWFDFHKQNKVNLGGIVGARPEEVVLMNSLTVNLHLLMVSFYRPTKNRFKILMEAGAFPSDQYAVESQVRFHGLNPEGAIIEIQPKEGDHLLKTEDILETIANNKNEVALILIGGVQYFTGQFFDLEKIVSTGHEAGAIVGFDLAHAAGNVPLKLHDWNVDFAVWCSYKYLNSGPGNLAGAFVHERHSNNRDLPRFAGWWGHDEDERFLMKKGFIPMQGADGWQLSNTNIIAASAVNASLALFDEIGIDRLRLKSMSLTGYAEFLLSDLCLKFTGLEIITPVEPEARGCQLSIQVSKNGKTIFDYLSKNGVIADWREPNQEAEQAGIIRIAPVPLYNSYLDVYNFASILKSALEQNNG